jgi:hypothetical protein
LNSYSESVSDVDDTFDRLLNIQSYNDAALKDLLQRLSEEEREVSKKRRLLHGEMDIVRAELVRRTRDKHAAGGNVVSEGDLSALTAILGAQGARNQALEGEKAAVGAQASASGGEPGPATDQGISSAPDVRDRFHDLSVNERDERLIRYITKQLGQGHSLDDILADQYMLSHTSEAKRAELLQNPRVIRALQDEIKRQFAEYGSSPKPTAEKSPGD